MLTGFYWLAGRLGLLRSLSYSMWFSMLNKFIL